MSSPERRTRLVGHLTRRVVAQPRLSAALLLLVLLTLTAAATMYGADAARRDARERVSRETESMVGTLQRRITAYTEMLVGVRGLFEIEEHPSQERFTQFAGGLQLAARYPGVQNTAFAEVVDPFELEAFERRLAPALAGTTRSGPVVFPDGHGRRQVVISHIDPVAPNRPALGFDLLSEKARADAVRLTQLTGRPAVTAPIRLVQTGRRGFLIVLAVRRHDPTLTHAEGGRLRGVAFAAFHADEFLHGVLPAGVPEADLEVYDLGASADPRPQEPSERNVIFDANHDRAALGPQDDTRAALVTLDVGGRRWAVHHTPVRAASGDVRLPITIAGGGMIASILASWLLLTLGLGRTRALALAQEMTVDLERTNADLLAAQARFRTAFDDAPIGMALVGMDGRWLQVNRALCRLLDLSPEALATMTVDTTTHPDDVHLDDEDVQDLVTGHSAGYRVDKRHRRPDGSIVWTTMSVSLVRDAAGDPLHFIVQVEDISERRRADAKFRGLLESAPDAMVIVDDRGRIALSNSQTEVLFGYTREELLGQPVDLLVPERLRGAHRRHREGYTHDPRARPMGVGLELFARRKDGTEFPVEISLSPLETDEGRLMSAAIRDVTGRKLEEEKLRYLAEHDELTGLRNRRTFEADLTRETARARRYGGEGAMLLIDIDSLKDVNDTLGHAQGDELIRSVGALIAARVRSTDLVARVGGDEFAVVMPSTSVEDARLVAEELLQNFRDHGIVLGAQRQRLSASIGVAGFGSAGQAVGEDVMVAADLALYRAKDEGRDRVAVYAPAAVEAAARQQRVAWSERLRTALDQGLLVAYRQPILTLGSEEITQFELLVRMIDPEGRPIPPSAFMPTAERSGLVREVDRFMIAQAIDLISAAAATGAPLTYEVNLSARSFADPGLPAFVSERLAATGADPSRLVFEITETAAITNMEQARNFATALRELGCKFALDDFGAGFASFYYLKHMPLDFLKIDGDFVRSITSNPTDQQVVRHIAELARTLGLATIAEFVEDDATLRLLDELGVDHVQGYHVGRPEPVPTTARRGDPAAPSV